MDPQPAPSHFANITARVGRRPQEGGLPLRDREAPLKSATLPHPGRILNSACRIYIPNGSLWNWERPHAKEPGMIMMMMGMGPRSRFAASNSLIYQYIIQLFNDSS